MKYSNWGGMKYIRLERSQSNFPLHRRENGNQKEKGTHVPRTDPTERKRTMEEIESWQSGSFSVRMLRYPSCHPTLGLWLGQFFSILLEKEKGWFCEALRQGILFSPPGGHTPPNPVVSGPIKGSKSGTDVVQCARTLWALCHLLFHNTWFYCLSSYWGCEDTEVYGGNMVCPRLHNWGMQRELEARQ